MCVGSASRLHPPSRDLAKRSAGGEQIPRLWRSSQQKHSTCAENVLLFLETADRLKEDDERESKESTTTTTTTFAGSEEDKVVPPQTVKHLSCFGSARADPVRITLK